jgi:hypothetical protein
MKTPENRLEYWLRGWNYFQECLLHDVRPVRFGFGINLVFNYAWTKEGNIREDVIERPQLATLSLLGVQYLRFSGGLTQGMLENPELINWGLSEISLVRQVECPDLLAIEVQWEGDREMRVHYAQFAFAPEEAPFTSELPGPE